GYSCPSAAPANNVRARSASAHRTQILHRLRSHEHESDYARLGPAVHPVVNGAALHEHIARAQMNHRAVELHVDLAREHHRVVERLGAMGARAPPGPGL